MKVILFFLGVLAGATVNASEDNRQQVSLPAAAEANLRAEMRANLVALNEILSLIAAGQIAEAGASAERNLGYTAMGKYRQEPFDARPGLHMPKAMHAIGLDGHRTASDFARIAAAGDREQTLKALPSLTTACVSCHHAYRIR